MANSLSALSDEDVAILQELINIHKGQLGNTPSRPPTERSWDEAEDHQAPEVYIAKPQTSAGIPKLLETGTGTGTDVSGSDFDEPGKAECDIYKIVVDSVSGDPELHPTGLTKIVHNLSPSDLDQDWILVIRTKAGKWIALLGGEEITVVTDYRVDAANLKLQKKTRTIKVIPTGDESDWIDVHTGTDCAGTGS